MPGSFEIDLVRPDAEAADCDQPVRRLQHLARQLRPGTDAEQVDALQRSDQMSLVESGLEMGQVGVAGAPDQLDSAVVYSLEQKNADLVFLKREHLAHVSSICREPML